MLSHKFKCIFVHIPKCGGTSIESILWPDKDDRTTSNLWMGFISKYNNKYQTGGLQHLLASQIQQEIGSNFFEEYFKFSIVRNPWDKAVSQFKYMKKRGDLREYIGMSEGDSFKKYLSLIQRRKHVQWESQYKFLTDESEKYIVDYIGRFESFNEHVIKILNQLCVNYSASIPHLNKSDLSDYRGFYNAELKKLVGDIYQKDIEKFEYEF